MNYRLTAAAVLLWTAAQPLLAAEVPDSALLRSELERIRQEYETQVRALESRIEALEQRESGTATGTATAAPVPTGGAVTGNAFNPALSMVLQGAVNGYTADPDSYTLPGFQTDDEAGLAPEGLTLGETELTASANVDHLFYAETTIALHDDAEGSGVEVEEAFVDPQVLPAGLGARFGRFYSAVGYLNSFHTHAWDFHDAPLAYRAMLGNQYRDDGVRLNWIAPIDLYLNLGAELLAGNSFPAGGSTHTPGNVYSLFANIGGDIGDSHAWQAGLSTLQVDVDARASSGSAGDSVFTGNSDLYIADFVWKWAPHGNATQQNFKLQGELLYRDEDGPLQYTSGVDQAQLAYSGHQYGYYLQGVYQFMPRWRTGLRYDRLSANNRLLVTNLGGFASAQDVIDGSGLNDAGHRPERWSLMLDWTPSEFSRLRAQYNRDDSRATQTDQQWSLQYIMSLGAHGAHAF